jgi:16S rRNA G966 N2-methylase RsmD
MTELQEAVYEILEGDCLEYLNQRAISNIHLSFVDPPFRQGRKEINK